MLRARSAEVTGLGCKLQRLGLGMGKAVVVEMRGGMKKGSIWGWMGWVTSSPATAEFENSF